MWGQFEVNYFAFYDFISEVLNIRLRDDYYELQKTSHMGPIYPLKPFCIICDRPELIYTNSNGLHKHGGPAFKYRDGWSIWALNGVIVPQIIAESYPKDFTLQMILEQKNAEVRREAIRKIGIEHFINLLDCKPKDSLGLYDLYSLDFGDGRYRPYLKMLNPSTGLWHFEGVHPNCTTVEQALTWRNSLEKWRDPIILT